MSTAKERATTICVRGAARETIHEGEDADAHAARMQDAAQMCAARACRATAAARRTQNGRRVRMAPRAAASQKDARRSARRRVTEKMTKSLKSFCLLLMQIVNFII